MIIVMLLIVFLIPAFAGVGIIFGKRRSAARTRRMELYRASPESHILNLRD